MRGSLQRGVFIGGCEVFQVLHVVVLKEPRWQFSRQFVQRYLEKNENPRSLRICFCFLNINGILKGEKKSARISLAIIRIKSPTSTEKARSGYDTQTCSRAFLCDRLYGHHTTWFGGKITSCMVLKVFRCIDDILPADKGKVITRASSNAIKNKHFTSRVK